MLSATYLTQLYSKDYEMTTFSPNFSPVNGCIGIFCKRSTSQKHSELAVATGQAD